MPFDKLILLGSTLLCVKYDYIVYFCHLLSLSIFTLSKISCLLQGSKCYFTHSDCITSAAKVLVTDIPRIEM